MSPVDYEILEFFEEHDIVVSAAVLAANIDYDRQYVNRHLNELADEGLLTSDDGMYSLSERGRAFLAGDLDGSEFERD
jgi:DNA-binding IclR family transcriptional regulator